MTGYEIHHGMVSMTGGDPFPGGCRAGAVYGTTWHGIFESDGFRRAVLRRVAAAAGRDFEPARVAFAAVRERHLDTLADLVAAHTDTDALLRLIEQGPPRRPPLRPPRSPMSSAAPDRSAPRGPAQPGTAATPGPRQPSAAFILLLSASDTDLLAARASGGPWRLANPARTATAEVPGLMDGAYCVVVRLLGGRRSWPDGLAAVLAGGLPVVVLSGEPDPDADLMAASTVPAGVAAQALAYLREGGPANLAELARFLSDTLLLTGEGFAPPAALPAHGRARRPRATAGPGRPWGSCSTGRTRCPGTPRSWTRSPTR